MTDQMGAEVKVAVLGSGSWGTTFANIVADAADLRTAEGHKTEVVLWGRRASVVDAINESSENPDYFPGVTLNEGLRATTDPAEALSGARVVVLAVPSQSLRENLAAWRPHIPSDAVVVSLMKGVELGSLMRMSQVVGEVLDFPEERIAVVSGPNLAREIAERQPATAVVACPHEETAVLLQDLFRSAYFRPYTSTDLVGVEIGGAMKNVIGLAVGVAEGMGLGDNTKASLITADWPRRPASRSPSARTSTPCPVWPGWVTSWRHAPPRCRGTGPSVRNWARARPSNRSSRRPSRRPRGSSPPSRSSNSGGPTGSTCRSPSPSSR